MAAMVMGRFSEVKEANEEIQQICDQVKVKAEERTKKKYVVYKAVQYRDQVMTEINYLIKVHVGGQSYLHLNAWKPNGGGPAVLSNVEGNHRKDDPIIDF